MNRSPRRKLLPKMRLVLFGVLLGLLIAELLLRISGYSNPEFYRADYSRGYSLRCGVEGWYRKEGSAFIQINSEGLRDFEHFFNKPPNTIRIALLGDSYAEAFQVPVEDAFWSVMSSTLNKQLAPSGKKIEVINFGVSGYGTAQELITLREQVWQYKPDIVLLAFTTNNDVSDNSRVLKKTSDVPYFVLKDGKLVLDDSFKNSRSFSLKASSVGAIGAWLYDHMVSLQAIAEGSLAAKLWFLRVKTRLESPPPPTPAASPTPDASHRHVLEHPAELGIDNFVYWEPTDPTWRDAWAVTENLLTVMNDEVKGKGARFVVVTLSNAAQVLPDPRQRAEFMKRFEIKDLFYPDRRIQLLGKRQGFDVIMLAPALQSMAEQNGLTLHGFDNNSGYGHWNSVGHRVAGELLAKDLYSEVARVK